MQRLVLLVIGLFFGAGFGFLAAAALGVTLDGHDHADPAQHAATDPHAAHAAHETPLDLPAADAPTLAVTLHPESGAVGLELTVTDFAFAPQHANGAHVPGEGHAHVYADGVKLGRIYAPWSHWAVPDGARKITVALYANDHRPLTVAGSRVAVTLPLGED